LRILFLTRASPGPCCGGDQLRAYHQLRLLAPRHRLTLVCFRHAPVPPEGVAAIAALCERVVTVPLGGVAMATSLARGVLLSLPFQVSLYRHPRMRRVLGDLVAGKTFDLAHTQLVRIAPYVEGFPHLASWTSWTRCPSA